MPGAAFVSLVPVARDMRVGCSQQPGPHRNSDNLSLYGHVSLNGVLFGGGGGMLNATHQRAEIT